MKFKIFEYESVSSTNDVAINLIKKENIETGYVKANLQTKGRGTVGKKWISKKGNFFCSLFFPMSKKIPTFDEFFLINPVLICDVLKNYCGIKYISFKWPNDVLVNGKKICGILQEVITKKNKNFLIIGIGINVKSSPKIKDFSSTCIFSESKQNPKISEIVTRVIKTYENFFLNLNSYEYSYYKARTNILKLQEIN